MPVVNGSSDSGPYAVAITWSGAFAYVANSAASTVSVIDTSTNTVVSTIGVGSTPHGVVLDGVFAYVTNEVSNTVSIIDTRTNTVVDTVEGVAALPEGIAMIYSSGTSGTAPPSPGPSPCRNLGG